MPNEQIKSYLNDAVQFAPVLERLKYDGEPIAENKMYQSLRQKKRRAFDVLSESLANLVIFMEHLRTNEKLRETLDDDLVRLFLSAEREDKFHVPMFWRLIDSLLDWNYDDNKKKGNHNIDNFRLILMSIMQDLICGQATSVAQFKTDAFVTDSIVKSDLIRACAWMRFFSANVILNE